MEDLLVVGDRGRLRLHGGNRLVHGLQLGLCQCVAHCVFFVERSQRVGVGGRDHGELPLSLEEVIEGGG